MTFPEQMTFAGWGLTALGLFYSIYRNHLSDARMKKAEAKIQDMESRGEGPYLVPAAESVGQVYEQDGTHLCFWNVMNGNVLSVSRDKVSDTVQDGNPVVLILENQGSNARRIGVTTDLKECILRQEPPIDGANNLIILKYTYQSDRAGKPCIVKLSFESHSGFQGEHVYETIHGFRAFRRIKPA